MRCICSKRFPNQVKFILYKQCWCWIIHIYSFKFLNLQFASSFYTFFLRCISMNWTLIFSTIKNISKISVTSHNSQLINGADNCTRQVSIYFAINNIKRKVTSRLALRVIAEMHQSTKIFIRTNMY